MQVLESNNLEGLHNRSRPRQSRGGHRKRKTSFTIVHADPMTRTLYPPKGQHIIISRQARLRDGVRYILGREAMLDWQNFSTQTDKISETCYSGSAKAPRTN